MEREKTCKIHGKLNPKDIWVQKYKRGNGKYYTYYICKHCVLTRRYRSKEEMSLFSESTELECLICKESLKINFFTPFEASRTQSRCNPCLLSANTKKWEKKLIKTHGVLFKLTNSDYVTMFKKQNGLCAICKNPETRVHHLTGKIFRLCIDHDHKTGLVRGLLCKLCNIMLGNAVDSKTTLINAAIYLDDFEKQELVK